MPATTNMINYEIYKFFARFLCISLYTKEPDDKRFDSGFPSIVSAAESLVAEKQQAREMLVETWKNRDVMCL